MCSSNPMRYSRLSSSNCKFMQVHWTLGSLNFSQMQLVAIIYPKALLSIAIKITPLYSSTRVVLPLPLLVVMLTLLIGTFSCASYVAYPFCVKSKISLISTKPCLIKHFATPFQISILSFKSAKNGGINATNANKVACKFCMLLFGSFFVYE